MTSFLQLAFAITVIILAAKTAGYISARIGQPSVLGELIVGLLLGPSLIDLTHLSFITNAHLHDTVYELGELGVLLLMFIAGMELHISDLRRNTRVSVFAGVLGVVVPVAFGYGMGIILGQPSDKAVFLGLSLGATSVSISAQTLMELGVLRSRIGFALLGAAVFDDILVILLLSIFLALIDSGGGGTIQILFVVLKIIIFLALSVGVGLWALPRFTRFIKKLSISQGSLSFAIVIMLVYGLAAELVGGMAAITGTFIAGLMFARTREKSAIEPGLHAIAYGFFVPIFFVSIGLGVNISSLGADALWIGFFVSLIAILGKLIGSGLGARLGRFSWSESLQISIGMISRGEVGLIVAQLGASQGLLDNTTFSAVVAMIIVTTLVTPPLLRSSFKLSPPTKQVNSMEVGS